MLQKTTSPDFSFSSAILKWFRIHGRKHLPWQKKPTPYRVWVSEIMLQQTQVATVIPYYQKFMQRFPSLSALASADEDQVLHCWTGLGYYARARYLHKTAAIIQRDYAGQFPQSIDLLQELPGIGLSTAGAILALALNQRAVILDGNVKRVLSRYHCVEGLPQQSQTIKKLWQLAEEHTPAQDCRDYTQAIMDLGATVCSRTKPDCTSCPLQSTCLAWLSGRCEDFPQRKIAKRLPQKFIHMLILLSPNKQQVLLKKRPVQGIWGGLWSFPEHTDTEQLQDWLNQFDCKTESNQLRNFRHTFSHFHLDIQPHLRTLLRQPSFVMEKPDWHWYDLKNPSELGLAAPVLNLLRQLEEAI
jgi:A/G-specific adenine glycosylase